MHWKPVCQMVGTQPVSKQWQGVQAGEGREGVCKLQLPEIIGEKCPDVKVIVTRGEKQQSKALDGVDSSCIKELFDDLT